MSVPKGLVKSTVGASVLQIISPLMCTQGPSEGLDRLIQRSGEHSHSETRRSAPFLGEVEEVMTLLDKLQPFISNAMGVSFRRGRDSASLLSFA